MCPADLMLLVEGYLKEPVLGSVPVGALAFDPCPSLKELERDARCQKKKQEQKTNRTGPGKEHPKKKRTGATSQAKAKKPKNKHEEARTV